MILNYFTGTIEIMNTDHTQIEKIVSEIVRTSKFYYFYFEIVVK